MEIYIIGKNSLRLKGKRVTLVVDPTEQLPKTSADAVIFLNGKDGKSAAKVADYRVIIDGPGGYEISGAKISGTRTSKGFFYRLSIDGVNIFLGPGADVKIEDFNACQVAIIDTSVDFNGSFVTALEPKIAVLYGDKKTESAKTLGAENASAVSKITIIKDKLPEKMEVVVLG